MKARLLLSTVAVTAAALSFTLSAGAANWTTDVRAKHPAASWTTDVRSNHPTASWTTGANRPGDYYNVRPNPCIGRIGRASL